LFREAAERNIKERQWKCVVFPCWFLVLIGVRYDNVQGTFENVVIDVINATCVEWVSEHLVRRSFGLRDVLMFRVFFSFEFIVWYHVEDEAQP
jgi:hypothetical protein